jgi:stage II sporulation protein D
MNLNMCHKGGKMNYTEIKKIYMITFLMATLIAFNSCVSMSNRYAGSQKTVIITQDDLKSRDAAKYSDKTARTDDKQTEKNIMIKILLEKTRGTVTITSDAQAKADISSVEPARKFVITIAADGNLVINGSNTQKNRIEITCPAGYLSCNSKSFRGDMIIYCVRDSIMVVNRLELDKYLYGVLPCEVSHSWDKEILKAQAVAARTFAIYNRLKNTIPEYDLDSGVASQVYKGRDVEAKSTNDAIDETSGEVLAYNGDVIQAFFHANSGGKTASSEEVWGGKNDYLVSVDDPYSQQSKGYKWNYKISRTKLSSIISNNKPGIGTIYEMFITDRTDSNRVNKIKIKGSDGEMMIKAKDIRAWIGVDQLRSTNFTISLNDDSFVFDGFGWGHGVGLSQEGARELAKEGRTYKEILFYYYKNVKIKKIRVE